MIYSKEICTINQYTLAYILSKNTGACLAQLSDAHVFLAEVQKPIYSSIPNLSWGIISMEGCKVGSGSSLQSINTILLYHVTRMLLT